MIFDSLDERNKFIENNLGLVKSRILKLNNNRFNEDLFQVGSLALIMATDRFDNNEEIEFSTYAVKYIDGYILKHKKYDVLIKPLQERGKWSFLYRDIVSLSDKIGDSETSIEDTISANVNIEKSVLDKMTVSDFLNSLSDRDRLIIELTINGFTQLKISEIVRTHRTNVSRIINRGGKQYINYYAI